MHRKKHRSTERYSQVHRKEHRCTEEHRKVHTGAQKGTQVYRKEHRCTEMYTQRGTHRCTKKNTGALKDTHRCIYVGVDAERVRTSTKRCTEACKVCRGRHR